MKLKEFKVGQIVEDIHGNIYRVLKVVDDTDDYQPVKLRCTKRSVHKAYITRPNNSYYEFNVGCEWWITIDELDDFTIV